MTVTSSLIDELPVIVIRIGATTVRLGIPWLLVQSANSLGLIELSAAVAAGPKLMAPVILSPPLSDAVKFTPRWSAGEDGGDGSVPPAGRCVCRGATGTYPVSGPVESGPDPATCPDVW